MSKKRFHWKRTNFLPFREECRNCRGRGHTIKLVKAVGVKEGNLQVMQSVKEKCRVCGGHGDRYCAPA